MITTMVKLTDTTKIYTGKHIEGNRIRISRGAAVTTLIRRAFGPYHAAFVDFQAFSICIDEHWILNIREILEVELCRTLIVLRQG